MLKLARFALLAAFTLPVVLAFENPLSLGRVDQLAAAVIGALWMVGCIRLLRWLTAFHV